MLGTIYGDIMGSTFEFDNTRDKDFVLPRNSSYTDDTILAVAVADATMSGGDYTKYIRRWCNAYDSPVGDYGGNFKRWLRSDRPRPYGSWGNGAVVRMMAIPWLIAGEKQIILEESTNITHNSDEAMTAVNKVSDFMSKMLAESDGKSNETAVKYIEELYAGDELAPEDYSGSAFTHFCSAEESTRAAFCAVAHTNSIEEAVRLAISFGGDSDTIAAIAGGLAETIYWEEREPLYKFISEYLEYDMMEVVDMFYESCIPTGRMPSTKRINLKDAISRSKTTGI